jgi:hypothetical protein
MEKLMKSKKRFSSNKLLNGKSSCKNNNFNNKIVYKYTSNENLYELANTTELSLLQKEKYFKVDNTINTDIR